jgi:hypothetical protein
VNAETIEHIALAITAITGAILLARYLLRASVRTVRVYEAVEGDGVEPGIRAWRNEVRQLLHQNVEEHVVLTENQRVIGMRLDEIQTELAHNGGTSIKDAVHRTERKLDDHLLAADARQEQLINHVRRMVQGLEAQGIDIPALEE